MQTTTTPSVFIGCLQCYNNGALVGDWYDATTAELVTSEDVHGGQTKHVVLCCFDSEGFAGMLEDEASPGEASHIAGFIEAIGDDEKVAAFAAWRRDEGRADHWEDSDYDDFEEQFEGVFDSEADFAQWLAEATGGQVREDWPYNHIDWEGAARDLFWSGEFARAELRNGKVAVWRNC